MNIYLEAFGIFFKIGAFTIGGGYGTSDRKRNRNQTELDFQG